MIKKNRIRLFDSRFALLMSVGCAVIIIIVFVMYTYESTVEAADQAIYQGKLVEITYHLQLYVDKYGVLPPRAAPSGAGGPPCSWRVLLLETLDTEALQHYNFAAPWNGPNNAKLASRMPPCFRKSRRQAVDDYTTSHLVVARMNGLLEDDGRKQFSRLQAPGDKVLIVESASSTVHWMEPRDLDAGGDNPQPQINSDRLRGPLALKADWTITQWPRELTAGQFRLMTSVVPSDLAP